MLLYGAYADFIEIKACGFTSMLAFPQFSWIAKKLWPQYLQIKYQIFVDIRPLQPHLIKLPGFGYFTTFSAEKFKIKFSRFKIKHYNEFCPPNVMIRFWFVVLCFRFRPSSDPLKVLMCTSFISSYFAFKLVDLYIILNWRISVNK